MRPFDRHQHKPPDVQGPAEHVLCANAQDVIPAFGKAPVAEAVGADAPRVIAAVDFNDDADGGREEVCDAVLDPVPRRGFDAVFSPVPRARAAQVLKLLERPPK